jgi:hypothetical protein
VSTPVVSIADTSIKSQGQHKSRKACMVCGRISARALCSMHAKDPASQKAVHLARRAAYRAKAGLA